MEPSSAAGGRRGRRALAPALVLVLLGAVAIASRGGTPSGEGGVRRPSDQLLDVVLSLTLVGLALGAPVVLVLFLFRRQAQEELRRLTGGSRRGPLATLAGLVTAGVLVLAAILVVRSRDRAVAGGAGAGGERAPGPARDGAEQAYDPEFATWPVAVVLGALVLAAVAAVVAHRSRQRAERPEPLALALADVLDETLDDLRAEPDARRAVIAAYARLERTLASYGLPRRPAEAPAEYLGRILADLEVGRRRVERLTDLFARAKFSTHPVGADTKEEAIAALAAVREELRAAEARAEAERAAALAAARRRAAAG